MNSVLKDVYDKHVPNFNEKIINGFSSSVVLHAAEYVDRVIQSSMRSTTSGLEYHGYRRLTPKEELETIVSGNGMKKPYDLAGTDIYLIELLFTYNGEKLHGRYLYLPFVKEGGIMAISGTDYYICPVLTDTVISPMDNKIFVRLLRDKLTFTSVKRNFYKNDKIHIGDIIYSEELLRIRVNNNNLGKVFPPSLFYVLGKYGVMESFMTYTGTEPIFTMDDKYAKELMKTHDVYTTTKRKPRGLKVDRYMPHNMSICVPKETNSHIAETFIHSMLYGFDILPELAKDFNKVINNKEVGKEIRYWRMLMSRITLKDTYSPDIGFTMINDHYKILDSYMDPMIREKLKESGMFVETIFDLLVMLNEDFNKLIADSKRYTNNIYNRYIDVLYYLLYDIIVGINKSVSEINKMSSKKHLGADKISSIMNMQLPKRRIFKISKSKEQNITLQLVDTSVDSKYLKITSVLELQERGRGVTRSSGNPFPENVRTLSGTDLFIGSLLFLPKKVPTPKVRINPFATYDDKTKRINPNVPTRNKLGLLDIMLAGRVDDANILNSVDDVVDEELLDL